MFIKQQSQRQRDQQPTSTNRVVRKANYRKPDPLFFAPHSIVLCLGTDNSNGVRDAESRFFSRL